MNNLTHSNRRQFLNWGSQGLAATAMLQFMADDGMLAAMDGQTTHHKPRVKRAIHICLVGGMSHIDSLDYRPKLEQLHGKTLDTNGPPDIFFGQVGLLRKSDWEFKQRGESGLWLSDMFPHIAEQADHLTVIRSMISDSANHTPALFVQNSGFQFNGFPSMGSWLAFGLGSETEELPTYVVLPDSRGGPNGGSSNWSNGFLPAQSQGVVLQGGDQPVRDLFPAGETNSIAESDLRGFLDKLNRRHLERFDDDQRLLARIRSYELSGRMQSSIPEAGNIDDETAETQKLYGLDDEKTADTGRRCLLTRRLLERGVRFVQLYSGGPIGGSPRASWDAHENVHQNHSVEAGRIDQPIGALLQDLHQRGMLDDTLVLFTTEFGRTPFTQSAADKVGTGRDHNRYAFSCWLAGGGLQSGTSYGETDDVGWKIAENPVTWHDLHATILHLFGIDHERLTYYHNGIQRRLTNVHGHVVKDILT